MAAEFLGHINSLEELISIIDETMSGITLSGPDQQEVRAQLNRVHNLINASRLVAGDLAVAAGVRGRP